MSAQIVRLPTSADVDLNVSLEGKVLAAKRSDAFDLLHTARGLTDAQHRAARRLFRDWCLQAGVKDGDNHQDLFDPKVDGGRPDATGRLNQVMIDAGKRISAALHGDPEKLLPGIGPVNAKLLSALISPMVDLGQVIAWRGVVQRVTGETDRNAQGAMVRQACEALRLVYEAADRRRGAAGELASAEVRPFSTFQGGSS